MKDLKQKSLELRREISRLLLFFKSLLRQTALPLSDHLIRVNNNTRGHGDRLIQGPARTQVYANSILNYRCIKNMNGLPETVVRAATVDT